MTKRSQRFTRRERALRIYNRINKAGDKGISAKQIARNERISLSRVHDYLRQLRKGRTKQKRRIDRLGRKYYRVRPFKVPARREPASSAIWRPLLRGVQAELRGYLNYASSSRESRNVDVDCVMLVSNDNSAILEGTRRIKEIVEARLGEKLASMLKFGVSEATASSADHFLCRRRGGSWIEF